MALPTLPTLFLKPATSLIGPWPAQAVLPRAFVKDQAADYESEMAIVIGKDAKNVSEEEAMDYVLGYVRDVLRATTVLPACNIRKRCSG